MTESRVTLGYSGSKNVTAQRQELNKVQCSDVGSSMDTVQLRRHPVTSSLNTRAAQEVSPLLHSDSEHFSPGSSQRPPRGYQPSPNTQCTDSSGCSKLPTTVAPCQDKQHKQTTSSVKLNPAVKLISQKRCREFEDCDDKAKKPCLQRTPKPTVRRSLSTSLVSQPSSEPSSVLELSSKTTDSHLCTERLCGQSTNLELSSTFKPTQSSCTSLSPKSCIKRRPSMGAKQAYINFSENHTVEIIELSSNSKQAESLKKRCKENDKGDKSSSLLSSEVPQKDSGSLPNFQLGSPHSGHTHRSASVLPPKTLSRGNQVEESRKSDNVTSKSASKASSGSLSCHTVERNKTARTRKPVAIPDDINDLFTPDPMTYVVCPSHKTTKPKIVEGKIKSSTSEKSCSSTAVSSSSTTQNFTETPHAVDTKVSSLSSSCHPQVSLPSVALERIKLENLRTFSPKDNKVKHSPVTSSCRQLEDESVKSDEKHTFVLSNSIRPCTDTAASGQTSTSYCSQKESSQGRKHVNEEDPIDVELDLGLSFVIDLDLTQSSQSSEEEQLLSLQEMMERVTKPPDTPEKGALSEPSSPGHCSRQSKTRLLPTTAKSGIYKNNLDQMLKEINTNKKAKEIETQLLTACKEDLLRIAEYEEAEENREEGISTEHQEFLQRYSLMSSAIAEVPPGEVVFNLEKFGRIFNHDTLQLRQCTVNPQGAAQKTLLWSSPAQLRLHLNIGLFQEAYDCHSPCPTQVTRFLFKMMSVHNERMLSEKILQALCDIACTAASQIVKNGNQQFKVWVPSLADVALVLMNMGAAFVTLFPFENLQPPFTEGDLLEDIYIKSESPSSNKEQSTFPEHNCNNVLKYLSYCMDLCPRAYSDDELLLLLTVVGRVGLDTRLILQSSVELYPLQYKIINNIRDWDTMLPRICLALTDLTDDHHNMCLLVQLLPDHTLGKQLRRHLSLSMISKLLDGNCTYRPTEKEVQLSELRLYLPRMQPSALLRGMLNSSNRSQKVREDMATLDQQSYYLCYSLLTLANEASNLQFFPARQKEQLLLLSSELDTHVKCDIRESEKCLYRSKVKDLLARISTKWEMLLQRTRPLNGKLYDYWQPRPPVDTQTSSQEEQEIDSSDGEGPVSEDDDDDYEEEEEETSETEENEVVMLAEDEEKGDRDNTMNDRRETGDDTKPEEMDGDNTMDDSKEMGDDMKPEEIDGDNAMDDRQERGADMEPEEKERDNTMDDRKATGDDTKPEEMELDNMMDDTNEREEAAGLVHGELNQDIPEMEPQVRRASEDEQIEAENVELTEVMTENLVETRETLVHTTRCDLVS